MSLTKVKKALKELEKEELQSLLEDLYKKHKVVKQQLDFAFCISEADLLVQFQTEVNKQLKFKNPRIIPAKAAIKEFHKFDSSPNAKIELLLTFVETSRDRHIDEYEYWCPENINKLPEQLEKQYEDALELAYQNHLLPMFKEKFQQIIVADYYFYRSLEQIYSMYYLDGKYRHQVNTKPVLEAPKNQKQAFDF